MQDQTQVQEAQAQNAKPKKKSKARKTSEIPTRVYKYGALPPDVGRDIFDDQIRMHCLYRRLLAWNERHRHWNREAVYRRAPALRVHLDGSDDPKGPRGLTFEEDLLEAVLEELRDHKRNKKSTEEWQERLEALRELFVATRDELRAAERAWWVAKKAEIARVRETRPQQPDFAGVLTELKACGPNSNRGKEARAAGALCRWFYLVAMDGGDLLDQLAVVEDLARLNAIEYRHAAQHAGLGHGSYCMAERAIEQSKDDSTELPKVPMFSREGMISVQLAGGVTAAELLSGTHPQLRLAPQTAEEMRPQRSTMPVCGDREAARRYRFSMRVGTGPNREARWVSPKMVLHRPIPDDAVIKWAHIKRKRIGRHEKYEVLLTLESRTFLPSEEPHERGTISIDIGWRRIFDTETGEVRSHRVAYWVDDEGREGQLLAPEGLPPAAPGDGADQGQVTLVMTPRAIRARENRARRRQRSFVGSMEQAAYVRSRRDTEMDEGRQRLLDLRNETVVPPPVWYRNATEGLVLWRRVSRFERLERVWAKNPSWKPAELEKLRAWLKHDRHLEAWECHNRERAIGRRRDAWLCFAVWAARTYSNIVIEATGSGSRSPGQGSKKDDKKGFRKDTHDMRERPYPEAGDDQNKAQRSVAHMMAPGELVEMLKRSCFKYGATFDEREPAGTTKACSACGCGEWNADARTAIVRKCLGCGLEIDQDANACRNLLAIASGKELPKFAGVLDLGEKREESVHRRSRVMGRVDVPKARRRDRSKKAA